MYTNRFNGKSLSIQCTQMRVNCVNPTVVMTDLAREFADSEHGVLLKERTPQKQFACAYILFNYFLISYTVDIIVIG